MSAPSLRQAGASLRYGILSPQYSSLGTITAIVPRVTPRKNAARFARRRIRTGKVCFFIYYGFKKFDMLEWTPARSSAEGS
jgi:hypothetical protein